MKLTRYQLLRNVSIASLLILTITACGGGSGGSSTSSSAQDTNSSTPGSNAARTPEPSPTPAPTTEPAPAPTSDPTPAPAPTPNPVVPVTVPAEPPAVSVEVPAQLSKIELKPADIVYDASRGRYYASIPSSNSDKSGRIAIIDPTTGTPKFSEVIGALPGVMALSRDAKYLYVAVSDSTDSMFGSIATTTEIVKLALPSLTEVSRVSLSSVDTTNGILYASDLEVSPANSDIFAVAIGSRSTSFREVVLYNGTTAYPKKASDPVPFPNSSQRVLTDQIAFSEDGTTLFGYDGLTTSYGLRKLAVTSEGLVHVLTRDIRIRGTRLESTLSLSANPPRLTMLGANPMIGGQVFGNNDLLYKGQYGTSMTCVPLANIDKVACVPGDTLDRLTVFSSATYEALGPIESATLPYGTKKLVKGPAGQVAVIVNTGTITVEDTNPIKLYLLGDPLLK